MSKLIDLTGQKFNKLTVIKRDNKRKHPIYWLCKCDCGKECVVEGNKLKAGETKSCGCAKSKLISEKNTTHGMSKTRLYRIWHSMKKRCEYPGSPAIKKNYQDRGIKVCQEWQIFENFMNWALANGYSQKLTIERKDNNKGYFPENCKWATYKEQANNKRNNMRITYNGITKNLVQWAKQFNIASDTLRRRIVNLGWSIENALTIPIEASKRGTPCRV